MTESSADLPAALPSLEECFKKYVIQSDERFKRIDQLLDDLPNRIIESLQKHGLIKGCSNDNNVKPMKPTLEKALKKGNGIVEISSLPTEVETSIPDQPPMVIEQTTEEAHDFAMVCAQEETDLSRSDREQSEIEKMVERQPYIDPYLGEPIQIKRQTEEWQIWGFNKICSKKMPTFLKLENILETARDEHRSTLKYHGKPVEKTLTKFGEPPEVKCIREARGDDAYILWDPGPKPMQQPDTHGGGHYLNGSITLEFLRHKGQQLCAETLRELEVSGVLMCLGHYNVQEKDSYQSCPKGMKPGHSLDQKYVNSLLNLQEKIRTLRPNLDQKKLQDQFDRTPLHKQNFQPRFGSQIWPLHRLGLIPFDPGIHVKLQGWKIEWQQRLTSGGELKRMQLESHQSRQPMIMHSQGMEQMKVPKPELKHMNEADINALKAKKVKRPTIAPALKEVPHLSLALFVLISIGIVLAISHMASKFGEYSTKHDPNWIREGNDSHQALPWALDQVLVRSIRNFKEPYFEATHRRLGYDVAFQYKAGKENQATDALSRRSNNDLGDKVKLEGAGNDGTHSINDQALQGVFINGTQDDMADNLCLDILDFIKGNSPFLSPTEQANKGDEFGHLHHGQHWIPCNNMDHNEELLLLDQALKRRQSRGTIKASVSSLSFNKRQL